MHSTIRSLYRELCGKYEDNAGAEIHLLGFSRGAFAVRSLACLIDKVGLLRKKHLQKFCDDVYETWRSQDEDRFKKWAAKDGWHQAIFPVKITSCGVWDTVSALLPPSTLSFVNHWVPSNLSFAFQALALHERRYLFNPKLWKHASRSKTRIYQCWFAGDHSDIGGSWPDCGLANLTLIWMLAQYEKHFPQMSINRRHLSERLCPPGAAFPSLSHTLSTGKYTNGTR